MLVKKTWGITRIVLFCIVSHIIMNPQQIVAGCKPKSLMGYWALKMAMKLRSTPQLISEQILVENDQYSLTKAEIAVEHKETSIAASYEFYDVYKGGGQKPPVVFIYAGIGGINKADRYMARYFASRGISAVISHYKEIFDSQDMSQLKQLLTRTIIASMAVTDYIVGHKNIDQDKLSLLGVSYGGIRASYISLLDSRFKSTTLVVASGSISKTIAYSSQPEVVALRTRLMLAHNLTQQEQFSSYFKQWLSFEPNDITCQSSFKNVAIHVATKDDWVPTKHQLELSRAMNDSEIEVYRMAHRGTYAWFAGRELKAALDFMNKFW